MRKRAGFGTLLVRWLRTLWLGFSRRCPKCQEGSMFSSYYEIRERCDRCGVKFQPYEGDILGVIATGYFGTVVPSLIALALSYAFLDLSAWGYFGVFALTMTATMLGLFPNFKGLWVALVYLMTGLKPGAL